MERADLALLLGAPAGLVAEARREATVIEEGDPRRFMAALAAATAQGGTVLLAGDTWGEQERRQLAALRRREPVTPATAAGKGWLCIPTGGTGGQLKFARHDEETLSAAVRGFARHFALPQVNAAGVLPLHHISGLMAWLRCALSGGEYRPLDWKAVEAGDLPSLPAKPQGWTISLVPTQLERLLRNAAAVKWLGKFRLILLGGGPAWPALLDQAAAARLPVSPGYGLTESAAMLTALRPGDFLAGGRSSGPVLPHATVKIGDEEVITIGGESLFRGYYPAWRDKWDYETGDCGRLDEHRHLHVLGRRDAVIITGGEKVDPAEVESVLRGTGEFPEVVVLGLPDTEWGQVIVAAYPGSTKPQLDKVSAALNRLLAPAKRPKRFVPLTSWPVGAAGKVDRAEVARLLLNLKPES
ncbi:MAG: 2-succinylbenzoate--CoA ligase [Lacunisphaera sp.]|nr:2-succinylbenzoate--CoA ligase [Lacunisphaera sp.]